MVDVAEDGAGAEEGVVGVVKLDAEDVDEILGRLARSQSRDGGGQFEIC